jgi:hypothetical protein
MTDEMTGRNEHELALEADRLLKQAGCTIWGNQRSSESYFQSRFEERMQTGAYSNCDSRRRNNGRR